MSTVAQHRVAIVAALASVPEIGRVHDRERYVREQSQFRDLYTFTPTGGTAQLRGWWLRRFSTAERDINIARTINVHTWQIRGYMTMNDAQATEPEFDGLVESFREVVRADPTLGGVCQIGPLTDGEDSTNGVQVTEMGPVNFCGVLCHSALLQLKTWSYL